MSLSQEQTEKFKTISDALLKKYNRAKVYAEMFAHMGDQPSAGVWGDMVSLLEPLVEIGKGGLDNEKDVETFNMQWQQAKRDLPYLYDAMGKLRVDYDDIWDDMSKLEDFTDDFLKEVIEKDLKIEQSKTAEPQKVEHGKEEQVVDKERQKSEVKPKVTEQETNELKIDAKVQENIIKVLWQVRMDLEMYIQSYKEGDRRMAMRTLNDMANDIIGASRDGLVSKQIRDDIFGIVNNILNNPDNVNLYQETMQKFYDYWDEKVGKNSESLKTKEGTQQNQDVLQKQKEAELQAKKTEPVSQKITEQEMVKPGDTTTGAPAGLNLDKKQENKDVLQKPQNLMAREDVQQDKVDEIPQSNKEAIEKLKAVANMFDRQHSDESFKNMMFALKDISESKLLPNEMIDSYRHIFNDVKEHHRNTEGGILDLSAEIYNQIADLKSADKEISTLNKVQDFIKHYGDVYKKGNPSEVAAELNKLRYIYNKDDFRSFDSNSVDAKINEMVDKLLENINDKESQQKTIEGLMNLTNKQKERLTEKYYQKSKIQQNKDVSQKTADSISQKEIHHDHTDDIKSKVEIFKIGTQKVLDLDKQMRQDRQKKLNQAALAEYRRRILLNRGSGSV